MITSAPFMSCREEQDFAGAVIDSLRFAADGDCITGKLDLSRLSRLEDALTRHEGSLDCVLSGFREVTEGETRSGLRLQVRGRLGLRCQRCLGEVDFECAIDRRLLLVSSDAGWPEDELEADDYDAITASREQSVLELVEEEILLALPIVPRHRDCRLPEDREPVSEESGASPFAALAGLKKH